MITKVLILGSGGHAVSCQELISKLSKISFMGFCSKNASLSKKYKIFSEKEILKKPKKFNNLINGVGHLKDNSVRKKLFIKFKKKVLNFQLLNLNTQ